MKIHFEQSGGIVAGVRRPPVTIDTETLPPADAKQWQDLVAATDFFNLPTKSPPGAARDAFAYHITVEADGKRHSLDAQGKAVSGALASLIERLRQSGLRHS
jgi:hypothetical protein